MRTGRPTGTWDHGRNPQEQQIRMLADAVTKWRNYSVMWIKRALAAEAELCNGENVMLRWPL